MAFSIPNPLKSLNLSSLQGLRAAKPTPDKPTVSPIAVDFGTSSLKILQVVRGGNQPGEIVAAASIATPPELLQKDPERLAFQFEALAGLVRSGGFKGKRAVCSVSARRTFVQHFQIKQDASGSIADKVRTQVATSAGCDPSLLILRHFEAGEVTRSGAKCMEVICFVMPRDTVLSHMRALKDAKLEPVGVHGEHLALVHMFDPITKRAEDDQLTSLYVDLGATTTKIAVAHGRKLALAKTIQCGLAHLKGRKAAAATAPVLVGAGASGGSSPTAPTVGPNEEPIIAEPADSNIPVDRRTGNAPPGIIDLPEGDPANPGVKLTPTVEQLTDEIAMAIRYHQALFAGRPLNRTIFVGGGSTDTELCRHVAKRLRVAAQVADPLSTFTATGRETPGVDFSTVQPGWALPLGLCLSPTDL